MQKVSKEKSEIICQHLFLILLGRPPQPCILCLSFCVWLCLSAPPPRGLLKHIPTSPADIPCGEILFIAENKSQDPQAALYKPAWVLLGNKRVHSRQRRRKESWPPLNPPELVRQALAIVGKVKPLERCQRRLGGPNYWFLICRCAAPSLGRGLSGLFFCFANQRS